MIEVFLAPLLALALPTSVDELPLAPKPIVLEPKFEQMMVELRQVLEAKKGTFESKEESYAFVRTYTDPLMEQLGASEFLVQSYIDMYQNLESGNEWAHALLPLVIFSRVYYKQKKLDFEGPIDLATIASRLSVENVGFRQFFRHNLRMVVDEETFLDAIKKLLREKWSVNDHCCNGLIDYVYVTDAFQGWALWHDIIGTRQREVMDALKSLEVLLLPYKGGFETEERWASQYERQGKDYRPELEAGFEILRDFMSEGGLPEKVFVAEILERAPVFRAEDIVAKLQEEEHPFIKVRLRYLDEHEE